MKKERVALPFTSQMSRWETFWALIYLPIHVLLLPLLLQLTLGDRISTTQLNFIVYAVGAVVMIALEWRFLRREFDPLVENVSRILLEILVCYGLMMACNMIISGFMNLLSLTSENPNNAAVMELSTKGRGMMEAAVVYLAPIVEELIFRAGIFGLIRKYNRKAAYAVSILLFAIYHVWGYAVTDPTLWLYLLQYLPVSYLLCRCYERCNTIWGSVLFHMMVNAISFRALSLLEEIL